MSSNSPWEMKQIGKVCSSIVPGRNKPKEFSGTIPWVTTPEITSRYIPGKSQTLYLSDYWIKQAGAKKVPSGSVIMVCVGDLGLVAIATEEVVLNQQLHAFVCPPSVHNEYCAYALEGQKTYMYKIASTTTIPYLNKTNCESIKIPLPPLPEQKAIADLLSTWDEAIEKTERLIQAKEKSFQLQLTEIISIIEKDRSTEFVELGKILSYEQPTKYIVKSSDYVENGKTPVLTANKSFILGHTNEKSGIYTDLPVIIFDDFTTDSKFVDFSFKVKSSALKILKPESNVDALLIYWLMTRINSPVGGHKRHWISEYQYNEIPLPEISLQKKLSRIIECAQQEIDLLKQLADKYKTQKRGLMQKLLTGEWRVKKEIVKQFKEV